MYPIEKKTGAVLGAKLVVKWPITKSIKVPCPTDFLQLSERIERAKSGKSKRGEKDEKKRQRKPKI